VANTARMISQLRTMMQLTQTEAQVARIRVAQARTEAVRRELSQNADHAEERTQAIAAELRRLGGFVDVVAPVVGRVGAFVKGTVDQVTPVDEALLGDLTLEHQLLDRARYLRSVAVAAKDTQVEKLADRLVEAHTATVEWLTVVLAEDALGGPAALSPTPLQVVAGGVTRAVYYPVRIAREQVNRVVGLVQSSGEELATKTQRAAGKAAQLSENARDVVLTGRAAAFDRAEDIARRDGATETAENLHEARTQMGTLHESELPIPAYDGLSKNDAVAAIKELQTTDDLNKVLHYEEANKNRQGVVSAAQTRYAALAKDIAGVQ
jgi:hypothetical protein